MSETTKAFGPIAEDYAFFQAHSTEATADVAGYLATLAQYPFPAGPIRMLDFGCGDGGFSARFHAAARFDPHRLHLTLLEPDSVYRNQAVERLSPFTAHPIQAYATLPEDLSESFELILSNHALYYVPDLTDTVTRLLRLLATPGLFLTAMAGTENRLIQFWTLGYGLLNRPIPYFTGADLLKLLNQMSQPYQQHFQNYELRFPDSTGNHLRILRFLMGQDFAEQLQPALLAEFDRFVQAGQVTMPIQHMHVLVRKG